MKGDFYGDGNRYRGVGDDSKTWEIDERIDTAIGEILDERRAMTRRKTVAYPIHKQGKRCGYEEQEDGSVIVAPMYADIIDGLFNRQEAVDLLIKSVTKHCHDLLCQITKETESFWRTILEDYGMDREKYVYSYRRDNRTISRKEKSKEQANDKT